MEKKRWDNTCKVAKTSSLVKLTFTANANTSVKVYFTKESYDVKKPDDIISLIVNQEKETVYDRKSIYKFKFDNRQAITSAKIEGSLLNCRGLFYSCSNLITLDVTKLDTSKVTDMIQMFDDCSSLTTLDVSHFDTSKVTNMYGMFYGCSSLTTLDLSNWDTSKVTNMDDMFGACFNLITTGPIDNASGWKHKPDSYFHMYGSTTTPDGRPFTTICNATPKPSWYKE